MEVSSGIITVHMGLLGLFAAAFSHYWQSDYHWFYQRNKFFINCNVSYL